MATEQEVKDAHSKVEKEYKQTMESLGDLYLAVEAVKSAGVHDDIAGLLDTVAKEAKKARTGGVIGSGAKGHARALNDYREMLGDAS